MHSDGDLQFDVCGNATTSSPSAASPEEKQKWFEFIYYRLLYFNTGVAALGLITFALVLFGEL